MLRCWFFEDIGSRCEKNTIKTGIQRQNRERRIAEKEHGRAESLKILIEEVGVVGVKSRIWTIELRTLRER